MNNIFSNFLNIIKGNKFDLIKRKFKYDKKIQDKLRKEFFNKQKGPLIINNKLKKDIKEIVKKSKENFLNSKKNFNKTTIVNNENISNNKRNVYNNGINEILNKINKNNYTKKIIDNKKNIENKITKLYSGGKNINFKNKYSKLDNFLNNKNFKQYKNNINKNLFNKFYKEGNKQNIKIINNSVSKDIKEIVSSALKSQENNELIKKINPMINNGTFKDKVIKNIKENKKEIISKIKLNDKIKNSETIKERIKILNKYPELKELSQKDKQDFFDFIKENDINIEKISKEKLKKVLDFYKDLKNDKDIKDIITFKDALKYAKNNGNNFFEEKEKIKQTIKDTIKELKKEGISNEGIKNFISNKEIINKSNDFIEKKTAIDISNIEGSKLDFEKIKNKDNLQKVNLEKLKSNLGLFKGLKDKSLENTNPELKGKIKDIIKNGRLNYIKGDKNKEIKINTKNKKKSIENEDINTRRKIEKGNEKKNIFSNFIFKKNKNKVIRNKIEIIKDKINNIEIELNILLYTIVFFIMMFNFSILFGLIIELKSFYFSQNSYNLETTTNFLLNFFSLLILSGGNYFFYNKIKQSLFGEKIE